MEHSVPLSKCLKGTACAYSNPSTLAIEAAVQESTSAAARRSLRSGLADPCNAYSTCSECLAAPSKLCGWCDTPVNYTDGAPGFNCAGFDQEGKSNPSWICHVQYRRDSCFDYGCSYANESAPVCPPSSSTPFIISLHTVETNPSLFCGRDRFATLCQKGSRV